MERFQMDKIAIITEFTYLYYLESAEQEFCNRGTQFCVTAGSTKAEFMGMLKELCITLKPTLPILTQQFFECC